MNKSIGTDVLAASSTFAVMGESSEGLGSFVVETTGEALLARIRAIGGKRNICFEE